MLQIGKLLLAVFASVAAFGLWKLFQLVYQQFTSPIRHLRGPKGTSWVYGNLREIWNAEDSVLYDEWVKHYGSTLKYKGLFSCDRLFTLDTRAISHVLTRSNDYQKPSLVRYNLSQVLGEGVLLVEGARHRQQRQIMNPAFGPAQIRALTGIFFEKAARLRDVLSSEISKDSAGTTTGARLDVMPWLSRTTLDIIGLAGFNYDLDALDANENPDELNEAFSTLIAASQTPNIFPILQARVPFLRIFVGVTDFLYHEHARRIRVAERTMARIGKELLWNAKAAARTGAAGRGDWKK